jgi:hypothetical protein
MHKTARILIANLMLGTFCPAAQPAVSPAAAEHAKSATPPDTLVGKFLNPPEASQPGCYWYWLNNKITKEGLTKDLESMKQVGIGRAYIGIISQGDANKTPLALSEEWWDYVRHAIREASRIGVEIGVFNSPGWSQSGGPWVKGEQSMRYVAGAELRLKGPQAFSGKLPEIKGAAGDLAVVAFPAPAFEDQAVPETGRTPTTVSFAATEPVTVRSATLVPKGKVAVTAEFQVSEDGQTYRTLKTMPLDRGNLEVKVGFTPLAPLVMALPPTTGRFFRLVFSQPCELGNIQLSSALRVESVYEKQFAKMFPGAIPTPQAYTWPEPPTADAEGLAVKATSVINLSSSVGPDGTLTWNVPAGDWIVRRMSLVSTGVKNSPAPPEATGLEVDKINRQHLKAHFDAFLGKLYASMPAEERKSWKYVIGDSYEVGAQNWTDGFAATFQQRYGYDPVPWLPVLSGRAVESAEKSDRFLWDLRRLVADRIATEYVGGLRELSREKGLSLWLENYGHWGFPAEFLQYGGQSDEIGGEFWVGGHLGKDEIRCAASAAHIYGKKVVWAESFTGGQAFVNTPRELKKSGDWSYSLGVNQPILHVYIHQPLDKTGPGTCTWFGSEFNRNNSWWNLGMKPWVDYQRRCTVTLQAGNPVADVAYYIGEDTPKMTAALQPALPAGYDYDFINAEVIEQRLTVKNGRFILPDGTSYRLLVLPEKTTMRPAVLRKIEALVAAGGTVLGSMPKRSPSLENYPESDAEVERLAKALWSSGKIRTDKDLKTVFADIKCPPDVIVPAGIVWKHRSEAGREIYFIANQEDKARTAKLSFRVSGKAPELWWPESGKIESAPAYKFQGDRVEVPLQLGPLTSVFVVFDKPASKDREAVAPPEPAAKEIAGPWQVQFGEKKATFATLSPWSELADPDVKYYSGEAVYRKEFEVDAVTENTVLDLGAVNAVARVKLNSEDLGTLWKAPYSYDVTKALKAGKNTLEVTVVHTWNNRIIGDQQPGAIPTIYMTRQMGKATDPLQPSGLLGPVTLRPKVVVTLPAN